MGSLTLALLAVTSGSGGTLLYQETFDRDPGWGSPGGGAYPWATYIVTNGQATLRSSRPSATDRNLYYNTVGAWFTQHYLSNRPGPTFVLSTDLVGANQDDAFLLLNVNSQGSGTYLVLKDQNEIGLWKHLGWPCALFFWHSAPLQNTNITLSLAFTRVGPNLVIDVTVADTATQAVLFRTNVVDTPQYDPVLPNRTVKGLWSRDEEDPSPWSGPAWLVSLGVWYGNPSRAPAGPVEVTIDNVRVWENQAPLADASASQLLFISPNGVNAAVTLDGSRSSDPDGDPSAYLWLSTINSQPSTILASGVQAVVLLPVGTHPIELVVNDDLATGTNAITVEVITTAEAVERLIAQVASSWPRSRPLLATLYAALHSLERGNTISALNQLRAFQRQVRAQVGRRDPGLAAGFTQMAQEIIDALSAGNGNPAGRRPGRLISRAK